MSNSVQYRVAYLHPRSGKPTLRRVHGQSTFDLRTAKWACDELRSHSITPTYFKAGNEESAKARLQRKSS